MFSLKQYHTPKPISCSATVFFNKPARSAVWGSMFRSAHWNGSPSKSQSITFTSGLENPSHKQHLSSFQATVSNSTKIVGSGFEQIGKSFEPLASNLRRVWLDLAPGFGLLPVAATRVQGGWELNARTDSNCSL